MRLIDANALIKAIENDCPEQVYYTKKDAIECVLCLSAVDAAPVGLKMNEWINVKDRLPEAEKRVLVCAEIRLTDGKVRRHITTGMYEDGTVRRAESDWNFKDLEYHTYDEDWDDWKIPEGWWEYTIYNSEELNYPINDVVTHWMPLPEPREEWHKMTDQQVIEQLTEMQCRYMSLRFSEAEWTAIERAKEVLAERD